MPKFNEDQKKAIEATNANILVSAAAGSGKTTVMVSRIAEEIVRTDKTIDRFLVITFTKDAADHMKRKLEDELTARANPPGGRDHANAAEAEKAERALQSIDSAAISTIHSFCMNAIREHFDAAGVSSEVKAIETDLPERMLDEAYIRALEATRGENTTKEEKAAVNKLAAAFSQTDIQESVRILYNTLMGMPFPFDTLDRILRDPAEAWKNEIRKAVRMDLKEAEEIAAQEEAYLQHPFVPEKAVPVLEKDLGILREFLRRMDENMSDAELCRVLQSTAAGFDSLRVVKCPAESADIYEQIKDTRKKIKNAGNIFETAAGELLSLEDEAQAADNELIRQELRGLEVLLKLTFREYQKAKQEIGAIDFSDMEQMAFMLLQDENIRAELLEKYTEIYVDECQDISAIQDAIIQSFRETGHTLFMVGDIKQSIYRFRHAEPGLFDAKRRAFSDAEDAENRRIFFTDNYRSCRTVVECINEVFENCMAHEVTELDYEEEDHLRANAEGEYGPVEVHLLDREEKDETDDMLEAQCREAGGIIEGLIRDGYHYRDIAILLRAAQSDAPKMTEFFKRLHIPVFYDGPQSFFGLNEIAFFLDLLSSIQNDRTDVELYGTLKNLPFSFSDEELAEMRIAKKDGPMWSAFHACADRNETAIDQRCHAAREQLRAWRDQSREMPVSDFIWQLMRETGFYASRGSYPDGKLRQANLDALYQKSLDLAKRGILRLPDFLREIHEVQITDRKTSDSPTTMGDEDDMIRIMTMHGSKGLEFPCVILMGLHKSLRGQGSRNPLRIEMGSEMPLGLYLPVVDRARHFRRYTYGKRAFEIRANRNAIAEDTRLLYVAMTRAEERLFLIGAFRRKDARLWTSRAKVSRLWRTRSMLDMIMPAVLGRMEMPETGESAAEGGWALSVRPPEAIREAEEETKEEFDEMIGKVLEMPAVKPEGLWEPEEAAAMPLKTSVTSLVRASLFAAAEEEETAETKRQPETAVSTFLLSEVAQKPAFMEEEKPQASDIGSATHRFLRLIDLDALDTAEDYDAALKEQLREMTAKGIFSPEEAGRIRTRDTAKFLRSDLGQRLIHGGEIRREWPFTLQVYPDQPMMVQGIIDAVFREDGEWVILDYKTDWDTAEETFVPRHQAQMNWYRMAVERITGIGVKEMWLVGLRGNKAYRVERMEVGI